MEAPSMVSHGPDKEGLVWEVIQNRKAVDPNKEKTLNTQCLA